MCGRSACTVRRGEGPTSIGPSYPYLPCRDNGFPAIRRRLTHGRLRYNSSCKNLPVSNSLQDSMPNPQGFLQVLADVPERSGPSGSSDCFVAPFNANPAKGLRIIFQGDRGRGTQNALGPASQSDSFVCADHDDEAYSRPMTTMCSPSVCQRPSPERATACVRALTTQALD